VKHVASIADMATNDEFVLSVVVRRRDDLEHPTTSADAIAMVRGLLEQGSFLDVLHVVGRRRFEHLPDPQADGLPSDAEERPESL